MVQPEKLSSSFASAKEVVVGGVEHPHIGRALDEHVDNRVATGADVFLYSPEKGESSLATEKHEKTNRDDRMVGPVDAPVFKICLDGLDRKPFQARVSVDARDRSGTCIHCNDTVAPSSCL